MAEEEKGTKGKEYTLIDKELFEELKKASQEKEELCDKYLRAMADLDNSKKRMQKEKEAFLKFANEGLIMELLPVMDSFDSAVAHTTNFTDKEMFLKGVKLLQEKFHKILEQNGLAIIKTVGGKFDPVMHEAVEKVESDKFDEGTVVEEVRRGYILNGMVMRPAMVKIAVGKGPSAPTILP